MQRVQGGQGRTRKMPAASSPLLQKTRLTSQSGRQAGRGMDEQMDNAQFRLSKGVQARGYISSCRRLALSRGKYWTIILSSRAPTSPTAFFCSPEVQLEGLRIVSLCKQPRRLRRSPSALPLEHSACCPKAQTTSGQEAGAPGAVGCWHLSLLGQGVLPTK